MQFVGPHTTRTRIRIVVTADEDCKQYQSFQGLLVAVLWWL